MVKPTEWEREPPASGSTRVHIETENYRDCFNVFAGRLGSPQVVQPEVYGNLWRLLLVFLCSLSLCQAKRFEGWPCFLGARSVARPNDVMGDVDWLSETNEDENGIEQQWDIFEKKWESKIVQMEPGSVECAISMAESPIQRSVQRDLEKIWSARTEKEDKIMLIKYETLNSTVERLGCEIYRSER